MNNWTEEAARLAKHRSTLLSDEQARDLADDLHRQCGGEGSAARAVGWFFAVMPPGWPAPTAESLNAHGLASEICSLAQQPQVGAAG